MGKFQQKKRANLPLILGLVLMAAGLLVYLFPHFTNAVYEHGVEQEREAFLAAVRAPAAAESAAAPDAPDATTEPKSTTVLDLLYEHLREENEKLFIEEQPKLGDPFAFEQTAVDLSVYGLDDNTIGYITVPKLDVVMPIVLGASEPNLMKGAAHLTGSSYPIGGVNTNCILAAHRGSRIHEMFRNIDRLEVGDEVIIENFRETLTYRVTKIFIIVPTAARELVIQEGRDMLTLITCHPLGQNKQRYVVFCDRVTE